MCFGFDFAGRLSSVRNVSSTGYKSVLEVLLRVFEERKGASLRTSFLADRDLLSLGQFGHLTAER